MSRDQDGPAGLARDALAQRLRAVAGALLPVPLPAPEADGAHDAAIVLDLLVRDLFREPGRDRVWAALVAVGAAYPSSELVARGHRLLDLSSPSGWTVWVLDEGMALLRERGRPDARVEVVHDEVLVDVDFCARHDHNTGIQRVVRTASPFWAGDPMRPARFVAWTDGDGGYRDLTALERRRVLEWDRRAEWLSGREPRGRSTATVLLPWRTTVLLPEVPSTEHCQVLTALAQHSGVAVAAIGYDCIPVLSAEHVPDAEPNRFVHYLTLVKHLRRMAGISVSATVEFQGFAEALAAQGLHGPDVVERLLPAEADARHPASRTGAARTRPLVLSVGSLEPRKNQLALLYACEVLWREGLDFELLLVGRYGWPTNALREELQRLQQAGRPVRADSLDDAALWAAYRDARFSVFTSLHEGYGLPVAESLACGTPVVTTRYGSTAEIAAEGGALLVDPRDDDDLVRALRRLLTDDDELAPAARRGRGPTHPVVGVLRRRGVGRPGGARVRGGARVSLLSRSRQRADALLRGRGTVTTALDERLATVLDTLGPRPDGDAGPVSAGPAARLAHRLAGADGSELWLTRAVLTGSLPLAEDVLADRRRERLDGPDAVVEPLVRTVLGWLSPDRVRSARVEVLVGRHHRRRAPHLADRPGHRHPAGRPRDRPLLGPRPRRAAGRLVADVHRDAAPGRQRAPHRPARRSPGAARQRPAVRGARPLAGPPRHCPSSRPSRRAPRGCSRWPAGRAARPA